MGEADEETLTLIKPLLVMETIKKGDIVKLNGNTLYTLESDLIGNKDDSYVTIQNINTGRTVTKKYSQLTLVKRLETLINTRLNAVNGTNDPRRIVGDITQLKTD